MALNHVYAGGIASLVDVAEVLQDGAAAAADVAPLDVDAAAEVDGVMA